MESTEPEDRSHQVSFVSQAEVRSKGLLQSALLWFARVQLLV